METLGMTEAGWIDVAGVMLVLLGIGLIVTEIFLPALGLFGVGGIAAVITGTVVLHNSGFMERAEIGIGWIIGLVTGLVALSLVTGWVTWRAYQEKAQAGPESLLGTTAEIIEWNGKTGRVRAQGDIWQAFSDHMLTLKPGDGVLIARVEDLHLKITTLQT